MLNGIAPVLIFNFPPPPKSTLVGGIPVLGEQIERLGFLPIPIYLDEQLTGIQVEEETHSIAFDINAEQTNDEKTLASVKGLDSTVTVRLNARKGNPILSALLTFSDIIFKKAVSQNFSITYLNGPILIFDGLLRSFDTSVGVDDDRIRINMTISKALIKDTKAVESNVIVTKTTGVAP